MAKNKTNTIEKQFVFNSDNIDEIIEKQSQGFSLPRYMNPWFKNQIGVRRSGVVYGMTNHEIDEFTKCAVDIHYFANNYCQIKSEDGKIKQMKLRDYQYKVLDTYTKNRFTLNMSSRQTGKCNSLITNILISRDPDGGDYDIVNFGELLKMYDINFEDSDVPVYDGNILNKIWYNKTIKDLYVLTITGWTRINEINITKQMPTYSISAEGGASLKCADTHLIMTENDGWKTVMDLSIGESVIVGNSFKKITNITFNNTLEPLYDISTDSGDYLTVGDIPSITNKTSIQDFVDSSFLSHNTVTAAISILHFAVFSVNKNTMIVANKADTVVEIIDKIKNIYKLLPFFMKPGLINWNSKSIVFENGCRIKSQARSKEPAIGFTIDFLYMDEFAHIPRNIINHYYKAAIPTVSSIKGSKIVITSTPNGANLFKDLVMGASLPDDHQDKNMYKLIKVLWWQVPDGKYNTKQGEVNGTRLDPKIYPIESELKKNGYTISKLYDEIKSLGYITERDIESTDNGDKHFIRILHKPDVSDIENVKSITLQNGMKIGKLSMITNWKEQETKLIGGEEAFNQEYNLQFIAGSKRVLSANKAKELEARLTEYNNIEIDVLNKRLKFETNQLRFAPDYIESERDKYYWVTAMDVSEGLGQDDSVINGFRLMVRDKEWLQQNKIKSLYDAFYLKQTFIYNYNRLDHKTELPELFYLLHFEYLNPEKTKSIIEYNGPGSAVLAALPGVYESNNKYGNAIFVRFKHRIEDKLKKIGLKVTRNKKTLVKSYIDCVESDKLYVDEQQTLEQMDNFIKVETRSGDFTFKADAGHDDIVMTNVDICTFFETQDFKNMCQMYYNDLSSDIQVSIDKSLDLDYNPNAISFKSTINGVRGGKSTGRSGRFSGGTPGRYSGGNGRYIRK